MEKLFTELLYQNQGIIHKICNIYFGNRKEKEDYKQELIIQLWRAFPTFQNQSKFSTWMYRVCLNASIDIIRKEKSQPQLINYENKYDFGITDCEKEQTTNQERLYCAINRLSDIDKAIITLYLEDFSYREISEITGISETNTGVKINRIKSLISKKIENGNR